jgi:transposase
LLADKGYDAGHLRQYCDRYRMRPVISLRTVKPKPKPKPKPGLPRLFDRPKYRQRNIIERMFGWLKESRRIGTCYGKLARSFAAMVTWLARCGVYGSTFRTEPSIQQHSDSLSSIPTM